eukprot:TRINITY_DN19889_c0_g1_i1.p1 TRINITY_DN19889_c0_g1~~TRINITY_DN19889_c0_g1_i1.p1  ORF type:complete len:399 (+),score=60.56 TRINITY_DN19889_c0_g1_i1:87-1283(+)
MFDPSSSQFLVYRIPICGGFCAPTVNQDKTCWRHFSNEYTVPGADKFMKAAPYVEHSMLCRTCGKTGPKCADHHRKKVLGFGLLVNAIALGLCIVGAVSCTTSDRDTLKAIAWVYGEGIDGQSRTISIWMSVHTTVVQVETQDENALAKKGLLRKGFEEVSHNVFEIANAWGDGACTGNGTMRETCEECNANQIAIPTLIMAAISQVPTMATNLQRSTRFGDVNCQKTLGILSNVLGFVGSFASMMSFRQACYTDMPETIDDVKLEWRLGAGFRCVLIATLIKVVDAVCHAFVPTPRQRWEPPDKDIEDVADYLLLAPPVCEEMKPGIPHEEMHPTVDNSDDVVTPALGGPQVEASPAADIAVITKDEACLGSGESKGDVVTPALVGKAEDPAGQATV